MNWSLYHGQSRSRVHQCQRRLLTGLITGVYFFTGPSISIEDVIERYVSRPPPQVKAIDLLYRRKREFLMYEQERMGISPTDLSVHVYNELGPETIVRISKDYTQVVWRLIVFRTEGIPVFLERIQEMRIKLSTLEHRLQWYEVKHLRTSRHDVGFDIHLSPTDELILREAWKRGYFSVPRKITLDDLSKDLNYSRSGIHYRLRKLVERIVGVHVDELLSGLSRLQ